VTNIREKGPPKGAQKSTKINKKGVLKTPSHSYGSPWVPMGSQGQLLMDLGFIFDGF
jgi:hypothetical protein